MCLLQRIRYVSTYPLSKIWYCKQILSIPEEASTRQINSLVAWFDEQEKYSGYPSRLCNCRWRKEVRWSSTYRPNAMCSFSVDAGNNCKPKTRSLVDGSDSGKYISTSINHRIWELFPHDFREICYTTTTLGHITGKDYSTSIYAHLRAVKYDATKMRILLQGPSTEWSQVWKNLHNVPINGAIRSTCYRMIHDLIPKQIRPFRSHRQSSSECTHCHTPDTLLIHSRNAKKLLTYGTGQGADWPSSLPSRHVAAFSHYVNMAQPQTRSHLIGRWSYGLYCY